MNKYTAFFSLVVIFFIIVLGFLYSKFNELYGEPSNIKYGVSFSPNLLTYLGLDYQKAYISMLDELNIKTIRLSSFWDKIQPKEEEFDFTQTDFMVNEAAKRNVKIIFVVGVKQPRWPECHIPDWAKNLSVSKKQQKALLYIQKTINHYFYNQNIWAWQVENEPLFSFGENCDKADIDFLKKEIQTVKSIDYKRPIIVTDTGEWRTWIDTMALSDILGISVYRNSYNPILGYISFPFPSFWYKEKSNLVRKVFASNNQKTIITELQAEPWVKDTFLGTPITEQIKLFTLKDFKKNIKFANNIGFNEAYLWGVEWWYLMRERGYPEYWDYAKTLF